MSPRYVAVRRCALRAVVGVAACAALLPGTAAPAAAPEPLAALLPTAPAPAAPMNPCGAATATAQFTAATDRTGLIDLYYDLPQGLAVSFYECFGVRAEWLGAMPSPAGSDRTIFMGAASWRCDRPERYFAATTTRRDGTVVLGATSVRTLSCAHRFAIDAPATVKAGRMMYIRVLDRWGIGEMQTRLCLRSPDSKRTCRTITFAKGVSAGTRRFRVKARGRWRAELQVGEDRVRDTITVGSRSTPRTLLPTLLATGDSTMAGIDSFLSDELGNQTTVVGDVRPGGSISRQYNWASVPGSQVARVQPQTTVLSIGANEGFAMASVGGAKHTCCDAGWIAEYSRRMRAAMLTYARDGLGRVLVLTIATPRERRRASITAAVNTSIVLAAEGLAGVRVLRMDLLFSPQGYSEVIRHEGADVDVREADGVHLNVAGTQIASRVVADAVREAPARDEQRNAIRR